MRQETRTLYSASELKEKFPDAFERAHRDFCNDQTEILWDGEIMDSLKGIFSAANVNLRDYSIDGICGHSTVKFDMENEIFGMTGKRAFAWIENNLLSKLRIPQTSLSVKTSKRRELAQYGSYYRAGMVKPCPFTGYCADDDFIEALLKDIKSGECLGDAFKGLADAAGKMREAENDYQQTEEYFLDHAEANDYEFDENGKRI